MNKNLDEALVLASEVISIVNEEVTTATETVLCVPFVYVATLGKLVENTPNISIGAQNCHQKAYGAYTGEISAQMLKSVGVKYVILGHSERRQYFGESSALLAEKVNAVLENDLLPIFCCGESLEQRNAEGFLDLVANQLTEGLFHLSAEAFGKVVIAYEPIWAIGTGLTASNEQAQEMHAYLRSHIAAHYGQAVADDTTIQYGGSVNEKNAEALFECPDVDGGLVGGASLKAKEFASIVKAMK